MIREWAFAVLAAAAWTALFFIVGTAETSGWAAALAPLSAWLGWWS